MKIFKGKVWFSILKLIFQIARKKIVQMSAVQKV